MNKLNLYDKILSPVVTEKSTNLSEQNKVTFKVPLMGHFTRAFKSSQRHSKSNRKAFKRHAKGDQQQSNAIKNQSKAFPGMGWSMGWHHSMIMT